jgi:Na+-translocating ferredoxin:NAD+ oxidoreductase RnfG subunit
MSAKKPTPKQEFIGCGVLVILGIIIALIGSLSNCVSNTLEAPEQKAAKEKQERKEKAEKEKEIVNSWFNGGSNFSCEDNLKEKLRDPDSYQRSSDFMVTSNNGNEKTYTWKFRAKNGFGGYNAGIGMCVVTKKNGGTVSATMLGQ